MVFTSKGVTRVPNGIADAVPPNGQGRGLCGPSPSWPTFSAESTSTWPAGTEFSGCGFGGGRAKGTGRRGEGMSRRTVQDPQRVSREDPPSTARKASALPFLNYPIGGNDRHGVGETVHPTVLSQ